MVVLALVVAIMVVAIMVTTLMVAALVLILVVALVLILVFALVLAFPFALPFTLALALALAILAVFSFLTFLSFLAMLLLLLKATLAFTHRIRCVTQVAKGLGNIKVPIRNTTDLTDPIIKIGSSIQCILRERFSTLNSGIDLSTTGDSVDTNFSNRLETLHRHGTDDIVEF